MGPSSISGVLLTGFHDAYWDHWSHISQSVARFALQHPVVRPRIVHGVCSHNSLAPWALLSTGGIPRGADMHTPIRATKHLFLGPMLFVEATKALYRRTVVEDLFFE